MYACYVTEGGSSESGLVTTASVFHRITTRSHGREFQSNQKDRGKEMNETLPSSHMPLDIAQKCYEIDNIIKMLKDCKKDGYSGFSLGLVIDLIVRDCNEV